MNEFRAWMSVMIFGGLGMAVLIGVRLPRDPGCEQPRRCYLDTMAEMQEHLGDATTALILFGCAVFSWFWFKLR